MSTRILLLLSSVALLSACRSSDNPSDLATSHDFAVPDLSTHDLAGRDLSGRDLAGVDLASSDMYEPLFAPQVKYNAQNNGIAIVQDDFTGDGRIDLVLLNYNDPKGTIYGNGVAPPTVTVFTGASDGTFTGGSPVTIPAFANVPSQVQGMVTADLNADTHNDLIVALADGIVVLLGNGVGGFSTPTKFSGGTANLDLAVGKIDGDDNLDIVTSDLFDGTTGYGKVRIFLGDGTGSFGNPISNAVGPENDPQAARNPSTVRIADMNGDGHNDLIVANSTVDPATNFVTVIPNAGTSMLSFGTPIETPTSHVLQALSVADLDAANGPDVIVTNFKDSSISVFLSTSATSVGFGTAAIYGVGDSPDAIRRADIDGDSKIDIVVANLGGGSVTVLYGGAGGAFDVATATRPGSESYGVDVGPQSVVSGDYNGDNKVDVATSSQKNGDISVLINSR